MPNMNHALRAMSWGITLKKLPNEISQFFPNGDPVKNRKEILLELKRLKLMGPKSRIEMDKFVSGKITREEYESNLDDIINDIDHIELENFRKNISCIENHIENCYIRMILPGVKAIDMDSNKFDEAIVSLSKLNLYKSKMVNMNKKLAHN